jgi:hypothetical protein
MRTEHLIYSCVNVSIELVLSLCLKSFSYRFLRSVFYSDTTLFLENAIFERIERSHFNVTKDFRSTLNESEFFNFMRTYFRSLATIESINNC